MLIEGVKYNAEKPSMIGKTFLRLERDFDKHVAYCRDEPNAQDFIATNDVVRDFFEVCTKAVDYSFDVLLKQNNNCNLANQVHIRYSNMLIIFHAQTVVVILRTSSNIFCYIERLKKYIINLNQVNLVRFFPNYQK